MVTEASAVPPGALSDVVSVVPRAVRVSNRWDPGTARSNGVPALSSLPPIEGRNNDIVKEFTPQSLLLPLLQLLDLEDVGSAYLIDASEH